MPSTQHIQSTTQNTQLHDQIAFNRTQTAYINGTKKINYTHNHKTNEK